MPENSQSSEARTKMKWQTPELEDLGTGIGDVASAAGPNADIEAAGSVS